MINGAGELVSRFLIAALHPNTDCTTMLYLPSRLGRVRKSNSDSLIPHVRR